MGITPDSKDATLVLQRPCDACGFDAATYQSAGTAALLRNHAQRWQQVLAKDDRLVRQAAYAATVCFCAPTPWRGCSRTS